ncbi:hypothetical protein HDE_14324 [Halotydeus destructor]|nr:hypothetical protein HDE_14324 [Halotydeus destructor]
MFATDTRLRLKDAPICKEGQKKLFGVATREPIQVPCSVEADPYQPLTFRWSLNGSSPALDSASNKVLELQPLKSFISSQLTSVLNYSPRTKYGYGQLFCWAKNSIGEQLEPCTFDIVPAGEPDPIQNCLVGNQSSDSLVVKCEPGSDGGLEQIFFLEVYKSGRGFLLSNLSSDRWPMFEVSGLPMSTPLVLVLFAANSKGRSNSVALTTATLPLPNKELNTLTPVIAVLLGIVGSLIVTAIAIMIVGRSRRNKETAPRGQGSARHGEGSERRKVTAVDSMITRDNDDRNNGYHGQRDTELHHYSKKKQNGVPQSQSHCFDAVGSVPYDISETWPGHEEPEMDKYILKDDPIPVLLDVGLADSHVTLEPRVPPEGDVFCDRSDSTSTMSSSFQYGNYGHHLLQQHGRNQLLHHHLPPPSSGHYEETTPQANEQSKLIRENSVVLLNENNSVITETPLINGLYYPDYSSTSSLRTFPQKGTSSKCQAVSDEREEHDVYITQ